MPHNIFEVIIEYPQIDMPQCINIEVINVKYIGEGEMPKLRS